MTKSDSILDLASPLPWNTTYPLDDITLDSSFAWLLCALFSSMTLVIYVTYYNSRVIGFILTKIINKFFIKNGYMKLGSFSVSVLSGKIMYRDVVYITADYSIRIQDGWIIFRWWRNYIKRDITSEDLSHADTRLSVLLNGLEVHTYNRSSVYSRMEKLFGLDSQVYPPGEEPNTDTKPDEDKTSFVDKATDNKGIQWRDLIPVIKIDISCGRFVFGNRLLPTTLLISVEEAHLVYTTKQASSRLDQFMHVTKCKAENFKVILAPSLKYTGMVDEPPRFMGEGFVVLQSNRVDLYYYMDEPGVVPEEPEMVQLANGDIIPQRTSPAWGVEIKCGKGTDFSYGPWADRQREELFKFFFPQDFQPLQVTNISKPGELRQCASFDVRLSSLADATIDILFSKNKETNAIHMNVGPGSYLEVTIPWITTETGYITRINGQLLHLDASTSLQYRSLMESETLEFDVKVAYPIDWNAHQDWTCNLTGCKATVTFIYEHKNFFQDLMVDWSSKAQPDLLHFVPFTWHFNIVLKEFELITLANEYNWVDCSSHNPENAHLAFCGEVFDLSFDLPLVEFLPKTVPMKFWIQGESVDLVLFLPEVNTSRHILISLDQNAKITNRDGTTRDKSEKERKWRNVATKSNHWIDCWTVPIVALSIGYTYHPVPPLGPRSHALDYTTPEKEEMILLPMRPPVGEEKSSKTREKFCSNFDPTTMSPDKIELELEIGPSVVFVYGTILSSLMNVKENYFGENQKFVDLDVSSKLPVTSKHNETFDDNEVPEEEFDPRLYRPLEITVSVTMHDIQGHLMTNCQDHDPPCPSLYLERFGFEMHKLYHETRLQLLLSPLILSATDTVPRLEAQTQLKDGHLALSGLQVRGHAMFSDEGRALDDETLEYAWLVEIQIGDITGRLTTPQVHQILNGLETFLFLVEDTENALQHPVPHKLCQHQVPQPQCAETLGDFFCPTTEEVKYRMTRLTVDVVEIYLVEAGTALCLQLYPLRFSTCNLHGYQTRVGITALIQEVRLKQYVLSNPHTNMFSTNGSHSQNPGDVWLEVGAVNLGPLFVDAAQAQTHPDMHIVQNKFLKLHDSKTKRLWFLWPPEMKLVQPKLVGRCGCVGGCCFFGSNRNGASLFQPNSSEESEGVNVAVFRILKDSSDLGYGQSLLHENQLIFDLPGMDHDLGDSPTQAKRFGMLCRTRTHPRNIASDTGTQPFFTKGAGDSCETLLSDQETTTSTENLKEFASRQNSYDTTTGSLMSMPIPCQPGHSNALPIGVSGSLDSQEPSNAASPSFSLPADSMSVPSDVVMPASTSVGSFLQDHQHVRQDSITSESKLSIELNSLQTSVPSLAGGGSVPMNIRRDSRSSLNGLPLPVISQSSSRQSLSNGSIRPMGPAHSPRTVRRALSTGSDSAQSSDIFFSAEELGHLTPEERKLLPHYVSGEYHHSLRRAPHGSKRSLQDIQEQSLQDSNPTLVQAPAESEGDVELQDNHSVSSTSFISALSSQEDLAMVDLHMQLNRPITESPLLMSCYTCHMTKLQCTHWYQPPPLPHVVPQPGGATQSQPWQNLPFSYFRTRWVPQFHTLSEGFTSIRMVEKGKGIKHAPPPPPLMKSPTHPHPWDFKPLGSGKNKKEDDNNEEEITCTCDSSVTKTTVMVKLKGAIEVFISPLMLEATQRFVEALTPTLASLHIMNIVNHLHSYCSSKVQSMNLLKKEKYMYVTQIREFRKAPVDPKRPSGQISPTSSTYEETQLSQLQVFIKVNKINVCILQSSIVEEVISFSALDNVRDLTCVSLLALCCDNLSAKIYSSSQSKKVIQTFTDDTPDSSLRGKNKNVRPKKAKTDWFPSEPVTIETNEVQQEENVLTVNVGKVHVQLRRLENSSSILKEAILTVISKQRSKVLFSFERVPSSIPLSSSVVDKDRMDAFGLHEPCFDFDDDKMGFIMFECGVEDFCLKMVKRMGYNGLTRDLNLTGSEETLASTQTISNKQSANLPKYSPSSKRDTLPRSDGIGGGSKHASTPSEQSEQESVYTSLKEAASKQELKGDVSSCVIELKTVWFNFAAPPYTPNTRKIDFTRLDWHLLSTASPAINSWMNPSDRLIISVKKLRQESAHRQNSVMACLMTEALDVQGIHMPVKGKYHKLTPLAKTLKEDPSCQLVTVLKRYVSTSDINVIEENLRGEFVPQLTTLRKGLVSVSRQWKNVLYMPMLIEQKYKMRKNLRPLVSFALPLVESIQNLEDDLEISVDDCEVTDEKTLLLKAEGGALSGPFLSKAAFNPVTSSPQGSAGESSSGSESLQDITEEGFSISTMSAKPRKRLPSYVPRSSRASIAFPVANNTLQSPVKSGMGATYFGSSNLPSAPSKLTSQNQLQVKMKRHESNYSLHSGTCSVSSIDPNPPSSSLGTPQRFPPESKQEDEDMYNWMVRQQDYMHITGDSQKLSTSAGLESNMNTLTTEHSGDEDILQSFPSPTLNLAPMTTQLADAHVIFEPLLSLLGVPSQITGTTIGQKFGPNISVSGSLTLLRVDIIESDNQRKLKRKHQKLSQERMQGKFFIDTGCESPAFLCDRLSVEVDLREVKDLERARIEETSLNSEKHHLQPTLVFASGDSFKKPTTTVVNFSLNISYISQQINMPLLRLLHQFFSMYQNVRETQLELKENRLSFHKENFMTHKKQDSSSGSESQQEATKVSSAPTITDASTLSPTPKDAILSGNGGTQKAQNGLGVKRPQSLTQRLRVSSKGYTNLNERAGSPLSLNLSESGAMDAADYSVASEKTIVDQIKENMPKCWRNMYYLLDLYATMPETKTVTNRSPVAPTDVSDEYKGNGKYEPLKEHKIDIDEPDASDSPSKGGHDKKKQGPSSQAKLKSMKRSFVVHDRVPTVVFGVVKIRRTRLLATLSGLKLEAELTTLHSSVTYKEKIRGSSKKWTESSVTGHLGRSMIVLLEGIAPNLQTVVKVTVGKSQALYSSHSRRAKDKNSALITIGPIIIDIPQHPVVLHGMMTRGSKQLSTTLQELRASRVPPRISRTSDELDNAATRSPKPSREPCPVQVEQPGQQQLLKPIAIHFSIILDSLIIGAALLPSLQAQYRMDQVTSSGVTGSKAKFTVNLPKHNLSFATKVQASEANLPSSASVELPPVHLSAEYIQQGHSSKQDSWDAQFADKIVLRQGGYLSAVAEIGAFEHSLSTDLLNHLVFVQKVFMKEVNEVVQKMSGSDKPVPLWGEDEKTQPVYQLLYTLQLRLKGIQITATTPTNSALRLETGILELQLSNRVQNMSFKKKRSSSSAKLFGKAHVDLNVSLGQLLKNALFEEAEPEFQQFAYFKTMISLRNALQDEMISSQSGGKEAVLITLNRPLVYIQPIALDKAVIVWLNYKNAYEYWNEQRATLNKEVLTATQQVIEKVTPISQLSSQTLGTLFLQLTIDDMGMCLPMNPDTTVGLSRHMYDADPRAACVVTLESTRISACSSGSLVSKGSFSGLCIRFADDFETSLDDWKPDPNDTSIMNLCIVSEGTYEVCSRTIINQGTENAKWILNVQWQMEGVDIHVDNNIGKQLSSLANTLTSLAGYEEDKEGTELDYDLGLADQVDGQRSSSQDVVVTRKPNALSDNYSGLVFNSSMDAKKRSRLIEKEMNEQAKIVNDLKTLGASQSTIEQEMRRLQELEAAVFNDFRRDVIKKLRRQSVRQASSIKDKLGLGSKSTSQLRSKSVVIPHSPSADHPLSNLPSPPGVSLTPSSVESSPTHGHTRTVSFDGANLARVTFDDASSMVRRYAMNFAVSSSDGLDKDVEAGMPLANSSRPLSPTVGYSRNAAPSHSTPEPTYSSSDSPPNYNLVHSDSDLDPDVFSSVLRKPAEHTPFSLGHTSASSSERPGLIPSAFKQTAPEPNIDFELDVKVFINSGKCVLHTKEFCRDDDKNKSFRKERSFSNSTFEFPTSPGNRKRSANVRPTTSSTKLKPLPTVAIPTVDFTVFLIPGLDVKVHYNSKTLSGDSPVGAVRTVSMMDLSSQDSRGMEGSVGLPKKPGIKKATLFAWLTLQGIPEECVITPQILDFLEQALEPIPMAIPPLKSSQLPPDTMESVFELNQNAFGTPATYVYASFPVDVTVFFRMQPSTLRFSCLPVSRVECLLRLPSLDLVISSKRAEDELYLSEFGDSNPPSKQAKPGMFSGINKESSASHGLQPPITDLSQAAVGGLSVTGCLADFSLYIFHPYGGKKAGLTVGSSREASSESSPLSDSERKDSLSLQVEFVKVNISRSRKINVNLESSGQAQPKSGSRNVDTKGAVIRFSAICDIGSASFKYDMRRLTEILAFPKAWYRRSIVRRLFLGDQSTGAFYSDQEDSLDNSSTPSSPLTPDSMTGKNEVFNFPVLPRSVHSSNQLSSSIPSSSPRSAPAASASSTGIPQTRRSTSSRREARERLHLNLENGLKPKRRAAASAPGTPRSNLVNGHQDPSVCLTPLQDHSHGNKGSSTWETLVLFAINLSKLNIHMNMGNVMGITMWTTRDTIAQGRLSIGSSGHKNMFLSLGLGGSSLDAKGGIVGGTIELSHIDTYVHIKEDPGMEPDHKLGMKLFALEARLDYMGSSMLMARVSSLTVTLRDEWRVNVDHSMDPSSLPTKRPALIFIHGDLGWDQLQLIISKSTTADLVKMVNKLEEFFTQQFKSSKRVFSSLQPRIPRHISKRHQNNLNKIPKKKVTDGNKQRELEARHHRHWQKVLSKVSGLQLTTLPLPLPKHGTILGGTMELHGNHISLACFHDINFRAKHWALFSLREPSISFATEAQSVVNPNAIDTHIVQNLSFSLGHNVADHPQHTSMATVCRISRNFLFPPQFRTMKEWFHYAFYISELDEVDRFPSLERDRSDSVTTERQQHQRTSSKGQDFTHTMECIFSLPSLQFILKTEHMQAEITPEVVDDKPVVECSFVTEFEDHIFVTVDAEAFFFLHDLITAYIKEKERTLDRTTAHTPEADGERKRKVAHPTELLQKDWRNYECKTWHLEPTVRLLSWAGKGIEPYGVDYILQKLGFAHARVTIPKWMQRGTMDPLDKILSVLMGKMVDAVREERDVPQPPDYASDFRG